MFTKLIRRGMAAPDEHFQRGYRSIANNLAILHILAVFLSISFCSVILYTTLLDQIGKFHTKALTELIVSLRTMLSAPDGLHLLEQDVQAQLYEPNNMRSYLRIVDQQGRVLLETPDMDRLLPSGVFPGKESGQDSIKWRAITGELFLIKSVPLHESLVNGAGGVMQIGIDTTEDEKLSIVLRNILATFTFVGLAFGIIGAIVVVRKGLKPLAEISKTFREISDQHLHTRLDPAAYPIEMHSLVVSFNTMLERLEGSFARLSSYTANLAHELRTPINNLMLEGDIALARARTPEEYREVLGSNMDEYRRLALIIDKLLFLARADSFQQNLHLESINAREEIDNIADLYSLYASRRGTEFAVEGQAVLRVDTELFRRAVSNLVDNAFKYTPDDGRIVITLRQGENLSGEVAVSDTGCGIAPEHLTLVFDRFFRADADNKEGMGLGLSIVRAIMSLHGGTVGVQSQSGIGTTVTLLFFPLLKSPRAPGEDANQSR